MANTRYAACVTAIGDALKVSRGRDIQAADYDRALSWAVEWFANIHPTGWPWQYVHMTIDQATESLSVVTNAGVAGTLWKIGENAAPLPDLNMNTYVATQVGASTGEYKKLAYKPWTTMIQSSSYYRGTDGYAVSGSSNQDFWSVKTTQTGVATTRPTMSIETFPYKYAGATAAEKLFYEIVYKRRIEPVASGANADDSFLWENENWDMIVIYMAQVHLAHQLGDNDIFNRSWNVAREMSRIALQSVGETNRKVSLPAPIVRTSLENVE